jgi:hypothetical protein
MMKRIALTAQMKKMKAELASFVKDVLDGRVKIDVS